VAVQRVAAEPRGQIRGRPVEAVLFDLDGTLVETDDRAVENLAQRLQHVRVLLPEGDAERVARRVIMWSHDRVAGWLEALDRAGLDTAAERLAQQIGMIDNSTPDQPLEPVAGTTELIHDLNGRYKLGIVSGRRQAEIQEYLAQHDLNGQIQVVVGSDTTERRTPHPQPLLWAAAQLAVPPEHVVMVGDTIADLRAAKAAGSLAVAVLCGFGEREDFDEADLILDTTADLAAVL
jgi:phosphoglycolate phosphatase-like HAD superfamily hydrolase